MDDASQQRIAEENGRLRQQLQELQRQRQADKDQFEERLVQERESGSKHIDSVKQQGAELQTLKQNIVKITRQLDDEVTKKDQALAEAATLERRVTDIASGQAVAASPGRSRARAGENEDYREKGMQVSTKLMRVVDQWMRQRDLQQALLRGAHINDQSFTTLGQVMTDCASLQTLDLSQNMLTMDSCSDICQLITTAPNLSFVSLADNLLSLRSVGYFMTAIMERQNAKKLMPLDLLDISGNEGLLAAATAPPPPGLLATVKAALHGQSLPPQGVELVAQVMRALWRFLHETGHPQVKGTSPDEVSFSCLDKVTLRKLENALSRIMLLGVEAGKEGSQRPVTGNLALFAHLESSQSHESPQRGGSGGASPLVGKVTTEGRGLGASGAGPYPSSGQAAAPEAASLVRTIARQPQQPPLRDPFADLKSSFEPPKEKLKTFNLKQIVTRNGTVLMNMLERLLETTDVDAYDVETEQTLLEYACNHGNMGLAKLCYRRGARLSGKTRKGDTPFNIVTKNKRYDMMEFLHMYGVKVNSCDKDGLCALHIAAQNDDVDGICRLVEWGAEVNIRDFKNQTPIHLAAAAGNTRATMLLLEVGADMNAKDDRLYTAAAHANMNSHFDLFDRLSDLGGRRHGQIKDTRFQGTQTRKIGELIVGSGMLKSSSLGRIGKISVEGMPGPIKPTLSKKG